MKIIIIILSIFTIQRAMAHGNHDSGAVKPQRGGILKSLETVHIELVQVKKEIRIYIYSTDKEPAPLKTKGYPVSAKVILPRNKGVEKIQLVDKKDHWVATYDAKGLHRYNLEFSIKQGGHNDKLLFTIEPKK